jgi:eukaryotic-like serine/threonine-protein kinase
MRGLMMRTAVYDVFVDLTGSLLGGRYRVGQVLGRGGMGLVYEATQEGLDRKVALKVMHSHLDGDEAIRERFRREARAVAMIRHPNVVQINDCVEQPGEPPFLVMERLYGETLRDVSKKTPVLSGRRVATIAIQVLSALDAAHRRKVVHRDIKPDNVFLEHTTAQRDIVKLLDFGVAKLGGETDEAKKLTRLGHAIGTPAFMSPEQAMSDAVDGRSDLYALGATMYVALTGRKLYDVSDLHDLVGAIVRHVPAPVTSYRSDIDPALAGVIARALEKNPTARFASALEMASALAPFAQGSLPQATLQSAQREPAHDTLRDPAPPAPRTAPMPMRAAPPAPRAVPAPKKASSDQTVLAFAVSVGLIGTGLLVAGAIAITTSTPTRSAPPAAPSLQLIRPDPSPARAEPLPDIAPPAAPSATATATVVASSALPTATTTSALVAPSEPHECPAARLMKAQGRDRQAAQLALVCIRKGGSAPF